jgi:hypothetical protein
LAGIDGGNMNIEQMNTEELYDYVGFLLKEIDRITAEYEHLTDLKHSLKTAEHELSQRR